MTAPCHNSDHLFLTGPNLFLGESGAPLTKIDQEDTELIREHVLSVNSETAAGLMQTGRPANAPPAKVMSVLDDD